ncbi:MAG: hypothetical protein HQ472_08755 [Ignavibacteria bacterium]|nr:hypothetical protein [Ignavibacteria bacterium]
MKTSFERLVKPTSHCVKPFTTTLILCIATLILSNITLTADVFPSGGAREKPLTQGGSVTITWKIQFDAPLVDIEFWNGESGTTTTIAKGIPAQLEKYIWQIPQNLDDSRKIRFVVRDAIKPHTMDLSESFVTIQRMQPIVAGVNEIDAEALIVVRPNPANHIFEISWKSVKADNVVVTDVCGLTVARYHVETGAEAATIDVSGYAQGMYQAALFNGTERVGTASLVINR